MSSLWSSSRSAHPLNRTTRRAFLKVGAYGTAAAAFIVACGGGEDDDSSTPGGSPASTGSASTGSASTGGGGPGGTGQPSRSPGAFIRAGEYYLLPDETANAVADGVYPGRQGSDVTSSLDPYVEATGNIRIIHRHLYQFLVRKNIGPGIQPGSPESLNLMPNLAASWEESPDALTYTFKMRPGVKFHNVAPVNGREMTIEDWRSSLERFLDVGVYRTTLNTNLDNVSYPDDTTMVWQLKQPLAPLLSRLTDVVHTFGIMPRELNEDPQLAGSTPIGTNYRMLDHDNYQPSISRDYIRHEEYWEGKPFIQRWANPIIPEYANAQAQFIAQHIISFGPSVSDVIPMRGDVPEAVIVGNEPSWGARMMRIGEKDAASAPWSDVRVRIAARRAVDFEALANFLSSKSDFDAAGIPVQTTYATHMASDPAFWLDPREGQLGDASSNYLYDPAEAKKLLDAAGFENGVDLEFVELGEDIGGPYNPAYYQRNELLVAEYNKTDSFRAQMNLVPYKTFNEESLIGGHHYGFMIPWSTPADHDGAAYFFHSESDIGYNHYPDADIDRLAEAQRMEQDPLERVEILKSLQMRLAEVFPHIPAQGNSGSFLFEWPWLHNVVWTDSDNEDQGWRHWLDEAMPNRSG